LMENQEVGLLKLSYPASGAANPPWIPVDDIAFAPDAGKASLLMTSADSIYRIQSATFGFEPGTAYTASNWLGLVGVLARSIGSIRALACRWRFSSPLRL
jgi:hypothetical protein